MCMVDVLDESFYAWLYLYDTGVNIKLCSTQIYLKRSNLILCIITCWTAPVRTCVALGTYPFLITAKLTHSRHRVTWGPCYTVPTLVLTVVTIVTRYTGCKYGGSTSRI